MFWVVLLVVLVGLTLFFLDWVREHPLGTLAMLAGATYFVWRAYGFVTDAPADDPLIWEILGVTVLLMVIVGSIGSIVRRRRLKK